MAIEFSHETNQNPASDARRAEILADPGFGDYFTDHMVSMSSPSTSDTLSLLFDSRPSGLAAGPV
ncbi:MAG: hypothetical protein ACFNLE_03410, partial [Rothia aeria]